MTKKRLTNRIREFRIDYLDLTQEAMAHDLGFNLDKIKAAESGKASVREVARVMQPVYQVSLEWLLGELEGPAITRSGDKRPNRKAHPLGTRQRLSRNSHMDAWQQHELDRLTIEYPKLLRAVLKKNIGSPRFSAVIARMHFFLKEIESIFGSDEATVDCDSLVELLALDVYPLAEFPTLSSRNRRLEERMRTCLHKAAAPVYQKNNDEGLLLLMHNKPPRTLLPPGGFRKMMEAGLMDEGPPQTVTYYLASQKAVNVSAGVTGNSDSEQSFTRFLETDSKKPELPDGEPN